MREIQRFQEAFKKLNIKKRLKKVNYERLE